MDWKSLLAALLDQAPGFSSGVVVTALGAWAASRFRQSERRAEAARGLITPAKPLVDHLTQAKAHFESVVADPSGLGPHYYKLRVTALRDADETAMDRAIAGAVALPQDCLDHWSQALGLLRQLKQRHSEAVNFVGRPQAQQRLSAGSAEYRRVMTASIDGLRSAIRETRRYAPSDVRAATKSFET